MDTSKENILMCEKAKEVQKLWNPQVGDIYFRESRDGKQANRNGIKIIKHYNDTKEMIRSFPNRQTGEPIIIHRSWKDTACLIKRIWLPTQSQLQGMIHIREYMFAMRGHKHYFLVGDINKEKDWYELWGNSMEQLWLAFVMSERFGKYWSGKDWEDKE